MAYDSGKSGISDYMNNVLNELAVDHEVDVAILSRDARIFPRKSSHLNLLEYPDYLAQPLLNMIWHLYVLPHLIGWDRYDFIFLPAGNRRIFHGCPRYTIATCHDLSQFHVPAKYDMLRMYYIKTVVPHYLKKVNRICAISQSTKKDLMEIYHLPAEQIFVNHNGFDREKLKVSSGLVTQELLQRYALKKKYLLYIARLEHPGKNHINLIKAYELLPAHLRDNYDLVLAGADWSGAEIVKEYARQSPVRESVKFTGFVEDKYLASLYQGASLYVFPSLYEGFGVPLVEAMACGTPVICSDRSSLPEIGGDAVRLFNSDDPAQMSAVMTRVLENPEELNEMKTTGLSRSIQFDWVEHARRIIHTYEQDKITRH
jgi:glycosyltransferase involved in cell wall biosynthesis